MKRFLIKTAAAFGVSLGLTAAIAFGAIEPAAAAWSTVYDQIPLPVPSGSNNGSQSESLLQSYSISGGTLYALCTRSSGGQGSSVPIFMQCGALNFVPTNLSGSFTRYLNLSDARLDTGIVSVAASSPSSTNFAIARTAGTSYSLIGGATSASAVTTKAMWETNVASTYQAGTAIPVIVNGNYTGSGTVTAASTTFTVAAYTEVGGVETAITGITSAQQFTGTATNYTFNIPSTAGLAPGQHITIEVTMLVTTSANAATGQINSVGLTD